MFRANPNIQIASMMCENEAFVRGFLQFLELEDVTFTALSYKTQYYDAYSCRNDEPSRSHSNAICRH